MAQGNGAVPRPSLRPMTTAAQLFDLFRVHVSAAVAWERQALRRLGVRLGLLPNPQDGMFDGLMDELLARWPVDALDHPAARRQDGIRWAKLHEPRLAPMRLAA